MHEAAPTPADLSPIKASPAIEWASAFIARWQGVTASELCDCGPNFKIR